MRTKISYLVLAALAAAAWGCRTSDAALRQAFALDAPDIYFDVGEAELRTESAQILRQTAAFLISRPGTKLRIEGHCDDRDEPELCERRAQETARYLIAIGVPPERLIPIGYARARSECDDASEECRQGSRRVHFELLR
jgi:peptidoglycan-associated lipoprotein